MATAVCQAPKKAARQKLSQTTKIVLKYLKFINRESSAMIYELQKIMNIEAPLNVHTSNLWIEKGHDHKGYFKYP